MEQNKIRTYFLYAIGEIALVVIGILIALQVNNWNEQRKLRDAAVDHLQLLHGNLEEDRTQLREIHAKLTITLKSTEDMLDRFMKVKPMDRQALYDIIQILFEYNFQPNRNGLNVLINTSELGVLPDSVQKKINEYYDTVEAILERDEISNTFIKNQIEPYIFDRYSYTWGKGNPHPSMDFYENDRRPEVPLKGEAMIRDKRLEGLIYARRYQTLVQLSFYELGINDIDKLMTLISSN